MVLLLVLLMVAGCSTVQVSQDYREEMSFGKYMTYQWKKSSETPRTGDPRVDNPLLHERFHAAINSGLSTRGYKRSATPDFLVSYTYRITTKLESDPFSTGIGFGFGSDYRYGEIGFGSTVSVQEQDVGSLAIDFYDARTGALIWRGYGSDLVGTHWSPEETTAFVYKIVEAVLQQYPPK